MFILCTLRLILLNVLVLCVQERALKKKKEAAEEEARIALQEYDSSLGCLEDGGEEGTKLNKPSGRKVFGAAKKQPEQLSKRIESETTRTSDSEDDFEPRELGGPHAVKNEVEDVQIGTALIDESSVGQKSLFKVCHFTHLVVNSSLVILCWKFVISQLSMICCGVQNFDDIVKDPGPKTSYDVAIFASGSWKKVICLFIALLGIPFSL